ncbi:MAG: hypothetical protein IT260_06915 [Saprospiraceae bacterium]|nr:hypothetical protein [Saprospiraceae bacterium]
MKALRLSSSGFKVGNAQLGTRAQATGSVRVNVHDGDTVNVRLADNLGLRFLGIDSAEVSFTLPGTRKFVHLTDARWDAFFVEKAWRENALLEEDLLRHFELRLGDGQDVAPNHARHAARAEHALEKEMQADLKASGLAKEAFALFMAFGHEFLDGTGRLLCYLNSDRTNFKNHPEADTIALSSYNERQLSNGAALPYFIWPNIQPFLSIRPFAPEHVRPESFWKTVQRSSKLKQARNGVASARAAGLGVFSPDDPLRLAPFELRFLARKSRPDRFVIDLGKPGANQLLRPGQYFTIANPEDRLFIPSEYIPIFEMNGWQIG